MKINDKVQVVDKKKVDNDGHLEGNALNIIKESDYKGVVTKIEDGIHFVGFKNKLGWVTQGFKINEIEAI